MMKYFIFIAALTSVVSITDGEMIARCAGKMFDTRLCPFNKVSNITKVFVGSHSTGYLKRCHQKQGDCTLEINYNSLNDFFKDVIDKCNGTSACHRGLYAISGWQFKCEERMVPIHYQVIEYTCDDYDIKYFSYSTPSYTGKPFCPIHSQIALDEIYTGCTTYDYKQKQYVIKSTSYVVVIPPNYVYTIHNIKQKCEGKIACDQFEVPQIPVRTSPAADTCSKTNCLVIQYHCVNHEEDPVYTSCSQYQQNTNQNISCPRDGTSIHIKYVWQGRSIWNGCQNWSINTIECLHQVDGAQLSKIKRICNGQQSCVANISVSSASCRSRYGQAYSLTIYECRAAFQQRRFCNDENITLSCRNETIIHITNILYGDFYYAYYKWCDMLLEDFEEKQQGLYCEKNATLYNETFYREVISACEGKTQCDEGLIATAGPAIGPCYYARSATYDTMRLPDYVTLHYYCSPDKMTQSEGRRKEEYDVTTVDAVSERPDMEKIGNDRKPEWKQLLYIIVPVILVIVAVIAVVVGIIVYKRRKPVDRHNDLHPQTLTDTSDVLYEEAGSVRFGLANAIQPDKVSDEAKNDIRNKPVSQANECQPLYENTAFVAGTVKDDTVSAAPIYAKPKTTGLKKANADDVQSEPTPVIDVSTIIADGGATCSTPENELYSEVKQDRKQSPYPIELVENETYVAST